MKQHSIEKVLYWMIAATLFLPLVIWSDSLAPFHFGKVVVFRWMVEAMVVLWVALMLKDASYRPQLTWLTGLVTAFVGVVALTSVTGVDVARSFWGTFERMGGLFTFLHYLAWFWILVSVVRDGRQWRQLLLVSIGAAVISAFYGLLQEFEILTAWVQGEHLGNPVGTIGNAALFAGYLIVNFFFAAFFALRPEERRWVRLFAVGAGVVLGFAIFLAAVRGSIAAVAIGLLVFALLLPRRSRDGQRMKRWVLGVVLVAIVVGLLLVAFPQNPIVQTLFPHDLQSFGLGTRTVQTRLWAWGSSWQAFLDRPLRGWGPDNFYAGFNKHFNPQHYTSLGSETWFDRAHNVVLDVMVAHGIVGIIVFAGLLFMVARSLWRLRRQYPMIAAALMGAVVAYFIHDLWILDTFANYLMFFFIIAFVNWLAGLDKRFDKEETRGVGVMMRTSVIVLLALAMAVAGWWGGARPWQVNHQTVQAMRIGGQDADQALEHWRKALDHGYSGTPESLFQLALYAVRMEENDRLPSGRLDSSRVGLGPAASEETRRRVLSFAHRNLRDFLAEHPFEAQLHIFLGRIQNMLAQQYDGSYITRAEETMRRGVALSPTRPRMYYELAQAVLLQRRMEEALAIYEQARALNPDVGISWWYTGIVKANMGRADEGLADMRQAVERGLRIEENPLRLRQLASVHDTAGNTAVARELRQRADALEE